MKGQLPKAYLRLDPNIDQTHPDPGAFIRLLCAAARQPRRGRFKDRQVAEQALGKKRVASFLARRDLVRRGGGQLEVDGWDIWQEGDMTVGERMRRYRARHTTVTKGVTKTVTVTASPSRRRGSKAARQQGERGNHKPDPAAAAVAADSLGPNGDGPPRAAAASVRSGITHDPANPDHVRLIERCEELARIRSQVEGEEAGPDDVRLALEAVTLTTKGKRITDASLIDMPQAWLRRSIASCDDHERDLRDDDDGGRA